jgi:hypothetical protein
METKDQIYCPVCQENIALEDAYLHEMYVDRVEPPPEIVLHSRTGASQVVDLSRAKNNT